MSPEFQSPALFICDLQERFRDGIHEFQHVIATTQKVLKAAKILDIPVFVTTQLSSKLGPTVGELELDTAVANCDKTRFSMWTPDIIAAAARTYPATSHPQTATGASTITSAEAAQPAKLQVILVGIETHICIAQTTRDLLRAGHSVHVLADAVSSCNAPERRVALARLQCAGAVVTTSEAWLFEAVGDAQDARFRQVSALVRESKAATQAALAALCG